ncbi:MAG: NAD-dependent epimerase/dehydratase family protein [Kofleriaceae bacterium]|nr:NAD-dependent epimerase/dehydratase family protein [Myxococcales bacterium]MCB9561511.1 NAD-dependent epimerase/dehydratase family protein [Kofleriaceae bacterium]
MRVLVTGATAPFGAALVRALVEEPAVERVLGCAVGARGAELPDDDDRFGYHPIDLVRARAVHDLLWGPVRDAGVDAIVHAAQHRDPAARGRRVHALNVEATRQLLLACERHPTIRHVVVRSSADVYAVRASEPNLLDEDAPLDLDPAAPQWRRDRVEADLTACARLGTTPVRVTVLRCAELLAPGTGSQLWDYLRSRVCLRPLGFDPMLNVLSMADAVEAFRRALTRGAQGVFNVPGADTLPLSRVIARWGRLDVPVPGPLLAPLYRLRARGLGLTFRYDLNLSRFHFGGVLDGRRAAEILGYRPTHPIAWPVPRR